MAAPVRLVADGGDEGTTVTRTPGSIEVNPEPANFVPEAVVVFELCTIESSSYSIVCKVKHST